MNVRRMISVAAILSAFPSAAPAQDRLEPEDGKFNMADSDWDYTKKIREVLLKSDPSSHAARMICLPSNEPEWLVSVVQEDPDERGNDDKAAYFIEYAGAEKSLWLAEEKYRDVKVKKARADLDRQTAEAVRDVWRRMLVAVRYPDKSRNGEDGVDFHFSGLGGGQFREGQIWSPETTSSTGELVAIGYALREFALARPEECDEIRKAIRTKADRLRDKLDRPRGSK